LKLYETERSNLLSHQKQLSDQLIAAQMRNADAVKALESDQKSKLEIENLSKKVESFAQILKEKEKEIEVTNKALFDERQALEKEVESGLIAVKQREDDLNVKIRLLSDETKELIEALATERKAKEKLEKKVAEFAVILKVKDEQSGEEQRKLMDEKDEICRRLSTLVQEMQVRLCVCFFFFFFFFFFFKGVSKTVAGFEC
jgi:hypothetical protein